MEVVMAGGGQKRGRDAKKCHILSLQWETDPSFNPVGSLER